MLWLWSLCDTFLNEQRKGTQDRNPRDISGNTVPARTWAPFRSFCWCESRWLPRRGVQRNHVSFLFVFDSKCLPVFLAVSSFSETMLISQVSVGASVDIVIPSWEPTLYAWILFGLWRLALWAIIGLLVVNMQRVLEKSVILPFPGGVVWQWKPNPVGG